MAVFSTHRFRYAGGEAAFGWEHAVLTGAEAGCGVDGYVWTNVYAVRLCTFGPGHVVASTRDKTVLASTVVVCI